jgi:hypothetical protein
MILLTFIIGDLYIVGMTLLTLTYRHFSKVNLNVHVISQQRYVAGLPQLW